MRDMPAQHWVFTWASFKQIWLLLVHMMQNLSGGYVPKDLPHCREVGVPCPWKHSRPGWMGLWAPRSSWRCAGWLQKCWTFQVSSNPNRSGMVLPSQIVATLDGLFAATTPVLSALQLNEIKTSFDMFKQWLYCKYISD